jgi:hypothetical protein
LSQKDELLKNLRNDELLQLAEPLSKKPIDRKMSRKDLLKKVKSSLSTEEIKLKVNQIRSPEPKKQRTRNKLFTGGIAQVLFTVWSFVSALTYISFTYFFTFGINLKILTILGLIDTFFLLLSAFLNTILVMSLRGRFGESTIGLTSGATWLVASIIGVLYYICDFAGLTYDIVAPPYGTGITVNNLGYAMPYAYSLLLAIAMILIGVFFLFDRNLFPSADLPILAGLLYVLAGAFLLTNLPGLYFSFAFISYVFLISSPLSIAAGVVGAIVFFTGEQQNESR